LARLGHVVQEALPSIINQNYNYYTNNTNNIKIGENNVLYQKYEGHIGVVPLITRINKVGGIVV
jgi:hypothetical protein